MTEEEAVKKYCPHSSDSAGAWSKCIASSCMAWRRYEPFGSVEPERSTSGFCGLAGRPE